VLQVQVDRDKGENHQKIFFVFVMLEVEPKYIYKRSHGSAEIQSLYRVLTAC